MKSIIVLAVMLMMASLPAADSVRPNVIVIYSDDQGYGDASCLNPDSQFTTPHLDRLAREGITFTDGHCSDTVCTPSRYGLLTGRYSWRTELKRGVFGAERACLIAEGRTTLASLLRDQGYQTAMVGKWHLGMDFPGDRDSRDWSQPVRDMPLDKGFDYFWGIPASMNYGVLAWFDGRHAKVPPTLYTQKKPNHMALSDYRIMPPYDKTANVAPANKSGRVDGRLEVAPDFIDIECLDRFTSKAVEWMGQRDRDKPFFLYLALTAPHKPVVPMKRFRGQGQAGAYGEFVIETDWHVGRVLEFLDQQDLAENTLLVFTSDNGPETTWKQRAEKFHHQSNGQFREGKRSIYEGGHRVPFFIRWPAGIEQPGRRYNGPVCQTDLLATIAEMLGATLPANAGEDSQSFFRVLSDRTTQDRVPMIHHSANGGFAIREGQWKLVMPARKIRKRELYDLSADPGESNDVIAQNPAVAKRLEQALTGIVVNGRSTPGEAVPNDTGYWTDLSWMNEKDYLR
jgi:arylsulfatase A